MRSLIRPFLFAVARLGLFLAVVAWIVGQWWAIQIQTGLGWNLSGGSNGFAAFQHQRNEPADVTVDGHSRDHLFAFPPIFEDPYGGIYRGFSKLGVTYFYGGKPKWTILSVRHWLITSSLLTFNLLLHFIYRKRPEGEPCED